jgi:O-antigen ligase
VPPGRRRYLAYSALIGVSLLQLAITLSLFSAASQPRARSYDEASFSARVYIWNSAIQIVRDHPLTGVGMGMFRSSPVRQRYPVPGYEQQVLPHAHNEWLQIAADFGLPGVAIWVLIQGAAAWLLLRISRTGGAAERALAVGLLGGMLAHGVYALGDAIPLWDRLAFVGWWQLGLTAALHLFLGAESFGFLRNN